MLDDSLLDQVGPVTASIELRYQLESAEQLLRFTNSCEIFTPRQLSVLLRSVHDTDRSRRREWWSDVRACRRRRQLPVEQTPLQKVFTTSDEYGDLATQAMLSSVCWALARRRKTPEDAFQLMDTRGSGTIDRSQIAAALRWLGVKRPGVMDKQWNDQVDAFLRAIDRDGDDKIGIKEFKGALEPKLVDWELVEEIEDDDGPGIQTLAGLPTQPQIALESVLLTDAMTSQLAGGRFKVTWETKERFVQVWSTAGTLSEKPFAIWAPVSKKKTHVHIGYYGTPVLRSKVSAKVLTVLDTQSGGWFSEGGEPPQEFFDLFLPHPVAFRKVWSQHNEGQAKMGARSVFLWSPVPPNNSLCGLGFAATTEDQAPALTTLRCVPKAWTKALGARYVDRLWSDQGSGGDAASFWRPSTTEAMDAFLFAITTGRQSEDKPTMNTYAGNGFFVNMPAAAQIQAAIQAAKAAVALPSAAEEEDTVKWEIELEGGWEKLDADTAKLLDETLLAGRRKFRYSKRGQDYEVDLEGMLQSNVRTRRSRRIRNTRRARRGSAFVADHGFKRRDPVQVFSNSSRAWMDAVIDEIYSEDALADGKYKMPAGSMAINFANGMRKYVMPEQIAGVVRRMPAGAAAAPAQALPMAPTRTADAARAAPPQATAAAAGAAPAHVAAAPAQVAHAAAAPARLAHASQGQALPWRAGEPVRIYSNSKRDWLEGVVMEYAAEKCTRDGYSIAAGSLKVQSAAGVKWIMQDQILATVKRAS